MTTEIAILNKSAVALAADSAVTITRRGPGADPVVTKIYVDANKLFELIKGVPVGIMIYNSAELAGIPWETLIKVYRAESRLKRFDSLGEYADDFLAFVQDRVSSEIDEDALWRRWGKEIVEAIPKKTEELTLTADLRNRIARLVLKALLRTEEPPGIWSGLVIAGFGEADMFPSVFHARVGGVVEGWLVSVPQPVDRISNDRPAIIQPYAQTGDAIMFLQGIDPAVSNAVESFWHEWSSRLHKDVMEIVKTECGGSSPDERKDVGTLVKAYMDKSWATFAAYMNEEFHLKRVEPIEASAGFLSKGEIADLAESLVDLTSLRNRVSLDRQETVGGATDVAVISKGDGFVWVKRKHYFSHDRNPSWGIQQALGDVVSRLESLDRSESHDE